MTFVKKNYARMESNGTQIKVVLKQILTKFNYQHFQCWWGLLSIESVDNVSNGVFPKFVNFLESFMLPITVTSPALITLKTLVYGNWRAWQVAAIGPANSSLFESTEHFRLLMKLWTFKISCCTCSGYSIFSLFSSIYTFFFIRTSKIFEAFGCS